MTPTSSPTPLSVQTAYGRWLRTKEMVSLFGVSRWTLARWAERGLLKRKKDGGRWIWDSHSWIDYYNKYMR